MAVHRFHAACNACGKPFWLRVQIGYEPIQRFAAPCPNCESLLRGTFEPLDANSHRFASDQLHEILDDGPDLQEGGYDYPTLNIAVDLPMFLDQIHERQPPGITPFLRLSEVIPDSWMQNTYPRLHSSREVVSAALEPLVEAHLSGNTAMFDLQLQRVIAGTDIDLPRTPAPLTLLNVMRVAFFCSANPSMLAVLDQTRSLVRQLARQPTKAMDAFRQELAPDLVRELLQKSWRSSAELVLLQGALTPALIAEAIRDSGGPYDRLRSVRGDYQELAHAFIQGFEAASWAVGFFSTLENSAVRGHPHQFLSGKTLSLRQVCELHAKNREPLATGALSSLFGTVSRVTRNKIGHNAAHYDFRTGLISFDDQKVISLMDLQCELLQLFRLASWYAELAAVIELLAAGEDIHRRMFWEPRLAGAAGTIFLPRQSPFHPAPDESTPDRPFGN